MQIIAPHARETWFLKVRLEHRLMIFETKNAHQTWWFRDKVIN
jgi:hypothetical protein